VKDEPALLPVELSYLVMYSVAAKLASNSAECIGPYTGSTQDLQSGSFRWHRRGQD